MKERTASVASLTLITALFSGCLATTNLLTERNALPENYRTIAEKMVDRASQTCIKVTGRQDQDKDLWKKGRKMDTGDWAVRRFYTSNTDWYKVLTTSQGIWDALFYNTKTNEFVCGEHSWGKYTNAGSVKFEEYGASQKKLSGV